MAKVAAKPKVVAKPKVAKKAAVKKAPKVRAPKVKKAAAVRPKVPRRLPRNLELNLKLPRNQLKRSQRKLLPQLPQLMLAKPPLPSEHENSKPYAGAVHLIHLGPA